jgi:hypothetical protein
MSLQHSLIESVTLPRFDLVLSLKKRRELAYLLGDLHKHTWILLLWSVNDILTRCAGLNELTDELLLASLADRYARPSRFMGPLRAHRLPKLVAAPHS